jgi:MFS family permease
VREPLITPAFLLLATAHFAHALSFYLYLHLPAFLSGLGGTELFVGVLYGAMSGTAILARPFLGRVMDRRGRRPIMLAGGALGALACTGYLLVSSLGPLVWIVRIAHGLAEAMLFASLFALATDIVPASRRIEGIGLFGVSGMLPMAVGGWLGDRVLAFGGYDALFGASIGLSVLGLALSLPVAEPPRAEGEPPRGLAAALVDRALVPLWLGGLCFASALSAHFTFLKTYLLPTPALSVSGFFSTYALTAVALRIFAGRLPERLGPRRVLAASLVLLAGGLALLALPPGETSLLAAGLLAGAGHGYAFPVLLGLVVSRARPTERGAALALYTALFDSGTLLGGPLFGAIAERVSYAAMFLTASAMVLVGLAIFAVMDRRLRHDAAPPATA